MVNKALSAVWNIKHELEGKLPSNDMQQEVANVVFITKLITFLSSKKLVNTVHCSCHGPKFNACP